MNRIFVVAGLAILLTVTIYPMASQTSRAATVTWDGDQLFSGTQSFSGDTITLNSGNLTITGSLSFSSVTLIMSSTVTGRYHIEVAEGATFTLSRSTVQSSSSAYRYQFWVRPNATFQMDNCVLNNCGFSGSANNAGLALYLQSSYASVTNSTLTSNYGGIVVDNASAPFVYKNTISNNDWCGVAMTGSSTPVVDQNTLNGNCAVTPAPVIYNLLAAPVITNNTITNSKSGAAIWGIRMAGTAGQPAGSAIGNTITQNSNGIYLSAGNSVLRDNIITSNVFAADPANSGYGLADSTNSLVTNTVISGNSYGVLMVEAALTTYTGCLITNNTVCGIGGDAGSAGFGGIFINCTLYGNGKDVQFANILGGTAGGVCTLINTSYRNDSLQLWDNNAMLIIRWFLHVNVFYESNGTPAAAAPVKCADNKGGTQLLILTGADGWTPWMVLQQRTIGNKTEMNTSFAPYNISASKGSAFNYTVLKLDQSYEMALPLDDVAPSAKIDFPRASDIINRTSVEVTGTVEYPNVSIAINGVNAAISADGTWKAKVNLPKEGVNILALSAMDHGKNYYNTTIEVIRDITPPVVNLTSPLEGALTNQTSITVSGTVDDRTGRTFVNGQEVPVGPDGAFSAQVLLAEGPNTVRVDCADGVWNTVTTYIHVELDTYAPALNINSPPDGFATNASSVQIKGTTDAGSTVLVNGKPVALTATNFTATVALDEGNNFITVTSSDTAGNAKPFVLKVVRDSIPPKLNILSPADHGIVNDSLVQVRGSTEENALVKVNGGGVSMSGRNFVAEVRLASEGENIIYVDAYDALKNHVQIVLHVVLDTIAPELRITSPVPNFLTKADSFDIRGRTEPLTNVTIDGEPVDVDANGVFTAKLQLDHDGTYTYDIVAMDQAGNVAEEFPTVTRDTQVRYNISSPPNGLKTKLKTISVTGDVEPGATVKVNGNTVSVRLDNTFIAEVVLSDGANIITVTVQDKAQNVASTELTITKTKASTPSSGAIPGFEALALLSVLGAAVLAARGRKGL